MTLTASGCATALIMCSSAVTAFSGLPARVLAAEVAVAETGGGPARPRARPFLSLSAAFNPPAVPPSGPPAGATTPARTGRRIAGTARWVIPNSSDRPVDEARFWLYANRLAKRPGVLGDVNFHWLYPEGFSPASIRILAARVGTTAVEARIETLPPGPDTSARIKLPTPIPPGGEITVELDFVTDLPVRLGAFGCARSQCRMMGGFYPFPFHMGPGGFDPDSPPDRIDFAARVTAPPGTELVLGEVRARSDSGGSDGARDVVTDADGANVPYVTLVTDKSLRVDEAAAAGMRALFFHHRGRPPSSRDQVLPYVREDRVALVLDGVRRALEFLADAGVIRAAAAPERPLVLIEAPLRHELVQVHGNVILVSDRLFGIFPLERLRKFHRLELIRAVVSAVVNRAMQRVEPDPDVDLAADVIAIHLTEVMALKDFRRLERARDLLRPLAFIPAIDQLMYAPLVASSSSYFGDPDDRDVIRDDVRRFSHRRAGGRLLHAKLLDLLRPAGMARLSETMLAGGVPLRQAAVGVFGAPLDWFWGQWLNGPPPRLNYRLARVQTTPLPRRGGLLAPLLPAGVHVSIDVEREGSDVFEPVELRVTDRAGETHDLVWSERGRSHRFELDLPAGLSSVEVDPRHRLVESAVGSLDPADDPLTDNRKPRTWRFIYSGAAALVDVTAFSLSFAAAVRLKPRHDLRNGVLLLAHHSPSTTIGVESAYTRWFGAQADRNRLTSAAGLSLAAAVLDADFGVAGTETLRPSWRLAGSLFTEHDDRAYFVDPWRAIGMTAGVTYSLTGLNDGRRLSQIGAGVELLRLFELAPGHVLAINAQGGATFGDIQVRSQLLQIGGPTGLRGYAPGELFGRGRAVGRVELRNRYVSDLDWNLAHFTSIRGFGGNLFFESGLVTSCADLSFGSNDVFYDVGYSFRVLHDAFGVYQQLLSVDLAIPLNRHDRVCMGQHSLGLPGDPLAQPQAQVQRPPFVVLISFLPTF